MFKYLVIFTFTYFLYSQTFDKSVNTINKIIGWSDSLENKNEIRIYKDFSISNYMEIFRMFENDCKWNVQKISFYASEKDLDSLTKREKKRLIDQREDIKTIYSSEYIWLQILSHRIRNLPRWESFEYKLSKNEIELDDGELYLSESKITVLDGQSYQVYLRNGDDYNHFVYINLDSYLKEYPEIDELNYFQNILSVIQENFDFFK